MGKKKVFLTGATSFLGKRLFRLYPRENFEVIATAGHQEEGIDGVDLTEYSHISDFISKNKPHSIVHVGALVDLSRDFQIGKKCFEINTIGTMHLLESIKDIKPFFLYISSEEVYGNGPIPFKEDQRLDPPSPYAISKVAAEHLCQWYGREYDFPVVILRLGTFYGPEQPIHKYFAQTILHALKNESIPVNSGKKKRDYIYVDDAIELIIRIINSDCLMIKKRDEHLIVNGAGGKSHRLLEVIELTKKLTGSTSEVKIGAIPDRITERDEWLADISKAKDIFGWEPKTNLEQGLKETVEYFKSKI